MPTKDKIEEALKVLKADYQKSLDIFYPSVGNNGVTERNLTFQFSKSYLKKNKDAHAFMEVPFRPRPEKRIKHFDAIIIEKSALIFVESKRLYNKEQAKLIEGDVDRIRNKQNRRKILDRFYDDPPSNVYGLILAETWEIQTSIRNWWIDKGDLKYCQKWNDKGICGNMDDWKCDSLDVSSSYVNDDETHETTKIYILYAYKKLD